MEGLFNFTKMTEELGMDPDDIRQLLSIYRPELHKDMLELDKAICIPDWTFLKSKLHKMKGDAANMCLPLLSETFVEMEKTLLAKNLGVLTDQLNSAKALESRFELEAACFVGTETKV